MRDPINVQLRAGGDVNAEKVADYSWFFRTYFGRVAQAVNMVVFDRSRAEEITQDAFIQLWRKWSVVSGYEKPEAWVMWVAIRMALRSANRDRSRQQLERAEAATFSHNFPDIDLANAIYELTPMQRVVVVLFYLEDRPVAEIARTLHVSTSTVKQHLHRARGKLAELLREEVDHVD